MVRRRGPSARARVATRVRPGDNAWRKSIGLLASGVFLGVLAGYADRILASEAKQIPLGDPAASPIELSARSWRDVISRTFADFTRDQITAVAAGVTFFSLLALFPALGVFVSLYGLFADVGDASRQISTLQGVLPSGAVVVIGDQMKRLAATDHGRLGVTLLISLVLSTWSSNAAVKALIGGLNIAYEEREHRNFFVLNATSLAFTVGATLLSVVSVAAVAVGPEVLARAHLSNMAWLGFIRWPVLLILVTGLLSLLYRFGPCRPMARWRWITPGGLVGALGWLIMSLGFSFYVAHFGHYDRTYGSLGAVVGFMTWIWLSIIVVLFGAELNSELEAQTGHRPAQAGVGADGVIR